MIKRSRDAAPAKFFEDWLAVDVYPYGRGGVHRSAYRPRWASPDHGQQGGEETLP